ncbi:RING-H2 finger protein ATL79-like [Humulus lupulus]|uniref:RING-H2 finger protein ATL79-like n=1 Tax=Humulus lupulus TaxID=3486 RepID=UPI002B415F64|nr:RING-H2 finger protein ATL79-like [Humulus lupulus]
MRATIAPPAYKIHLSPPVASSTTTTSCDGPGCQWRPYSGTGHFEANAAMILIILLCALICALALNTAIRCFLRGHQQHHRPDAAQGRLQQQQQQQQKSNAGVAAAALEGVPALVYSAEVKTKLAGAETECAICLSEFEEGQGVRLMARCNHGFHDQCIHQWLSSHSSCPTCRSTCLPPSPLTPHHTIENCSSQRE